MSVAMSGDAHASLSKSIWNEELIVKVWKGISRSKTKKFSNVHTVDELSCVLQRHHT